MTPVIIAQLRATSTVDLMTAARALGLGRTKAYELARRRSFPAGSSASVAPTVSPPRACSSSSAPLPTRQTEGLPAGEAEGGERGDAYRLHARAPSGHGAACRRRAAATRRSFATQSLSVAAVPGKTGHGAAQETRYSSAQARRSGRSAHRSRLDLPNSGALTKRILMRRLAYSIEAQRQR
jgi:hypothetical protein